MLHPFMLLALPAALCTAAPSPVSYAVTSDSLELVYASGQTWEAFYSGVDRRRELWTRNWTNARVPAELVGRARTAGATWRILVITEPGCSDSANSIPYVARLAEAAGLELRLVRSAAGRPWMEAHRSPDGRAATPTVLVLDEQFRIRGCWVEQPAALQAIWLPIVARGEMAQRIDEKMTWYDQDEGRETLRELVEVMEAGRRGEVRCPGAN